MGSNLKLTQSRPHYKSPPHRILAPSDPLSNQPHSGPPRPSLSLNPSLCLCRGRPAWLLFRGPATVLLATLSLGPRRAQPGGGTDSASLARPGSQASGAARPLISPSRASGEDGHRVGCQAEGRGPSAQLGAGPPLPSPRTLTFWGLSSGPTRPLSGRPEASQGAEWAHLWGPSSVSSLRLPEPGKEALLSSLPR